MRKQPLSREIILDAAVALLDQEGMDALSMRKLGAALGVEAMSLYNHVESKAALLDGIHERILTSLDPPPASRNWQTFARHQAHALHRALLAHPNAVPLFASRPAATPTAIAQLELYVNLLVHAGFKPFDALSIVQLVSQLVIGHVMWTSGVEVAVVGAAPIPGPHLQRALEKWSPDRELELGIDALLHGFERIRAK
ncbi:MAG: TetR/AcrR family transcriptional regulator C-terminal domain-containing protein [Deltaproteobacteria bacterium]|nr:TetR/AcrR family transcriptional regulator C-terminal domain-containing protein [Deltaproteobacteria bacterium]